MRRILWLGIAAGFGGAACSQDSAPAATMGLSEGWNRLAGNEATVCSDGSPYAFFVRPGSSSELLLHFAGGGACSTAVTCDPDLEPTPYIRNLDGIDPAAAGGIFDFANEENPFRDYTVVFAPYCSGDVHLGDRVQQYQAPEMDGHAAHQVSVHHKGMVNAELVLNWTFEQLPAPRLVFVTGSSAGAIPSPFFAQWVAEQYRGARVGHLADSAAGYLPNANANPSSATADDVWGSYARLQQWPEFADLTPQDNAIVELYAGSAASAPDITWAAFDYAEDDVQKAFSGMLLGGDPNASLLPAILQNQSEIRGSVDRFRSYIASGELHTVLLDDAFYSLTVEGARLRDWVAELASFESVPDVRCSPCEPPSALRQ